VTGGYQSATGWHSLEPGAAPPGRRTRQARSVCPRSFLIDLSFSSATECGGPGALSAAGHLGRDVAVTQRLACTLSPRPASRRPPSMTWGSTVSGRAINCAHISRLGVALCGRGPGQGFGTNHCAGREPCQRGLATHLGWFANSPCLCRTTVRCNLCATWPRTETRPDRAAESYE